MNAHVIPPAPAPVIAAAGGIPAVQPQAVVRLWRRVEAVVESIIFYGLLGVGLSAPLLGAAYALLFR